MAVTREDIQAWIAEWEGDHAEGETLEAYLRSKVDPDEVVPMSLGDRHVELPLIDVILDDLPSYASS